MASKREKHYRVINGQLFARLVYVGSDGKRKEKHVKAESKTHARELYEKMKRELSDHGHQSLDASRMTFNDVAKAYEETRLQPAQYVGERKIAGLRSHTTPKRFLQTLREYFGKRHIKGITHADIEKFKLERLKTPTHKGTERAIASVNRELELLRAMFRFAARSGWLIKSPFEKGGTLISKADEVQRERILSRAEEDLLLLACTDRRAHLRAIVIAALDTACRRGELFLMRWSDVDFENRVISIRATTTKTQRARTVPISARLLMELQTLYQQVKSEDELVFGVTDTVKHSFASACRAAGIENFRLHDCRHTAITRMIQAGMTPMQVMKISGHTQMTTFARYVNVDGDAVKRAAAAIDAFHSAFHQQSIAESHLIN